MLDERENITVLAERANMPRGKAALVLKQAGIARDHYRLYPTKEALAALTAAVDQSRATGHQLAGKGSDGGSSNLDKLADARAAAEMARAEKIRIELEHKRGLLVSREEVLKAAGEFALMVRNNILGISPKLADACAHKSANEIARLADEIIREALDNLSDADKFALGEL